MPHVDCRLFLPLDGADAAASTADSTGRHNSITFNGSAQLDTAQKKFGTASLLLDGNSDYLTLPDSPDWDLVEAADNNWTIELWAKHDDHVGTEVYACQYEDANNYWIFQHVHGTGRQFVVVSGGVTVITLGGGEITDTNWHHVALCKVDDEYGLYLDGSQEAYVQDSSVDTFAGSLYIGADGVPGNYFDGHLDEIRTDKSNYFSAAPNVGTTDTITVPTAAYESYEILPTFPDDNVLSTWVDVTPFSDGPADDSMRRSSYEDGFPLVERRFTIDPMVISFSLSHLTEDDRDILEDFYKEHGHETIAFYHPTEEVYHECKFTSAPQRSVDEEKGYWKMDFDLRQVSSTTWS